MTQDELRRKCEEEARETYHLAVEDYKNAKSGFEKDASDGLRPIEFYWDKRITEALLQREMEIERLRNKIIEMEKTSRINALDGQCCFDEMGNEIKSLQEKLAVASSAFLKIVSGRYDSTPLVYKEVAKQALQQIGEV